MGNSESIFITRPIRSIRKNTFSYAHPHGNLVIVDTIHRNGYDYKYSITDIGFQDGKHMVQFICKGAKIHRKIPKEDIDDFIRNLGNILDTTTADNKKLFIKFRVSESEKETIERLAKMNNQNLSEFIKTRLTHSV